MLKKIILKWLLPKILSNACDSRIPRSGEAGENVNCFVFAIDRNESPFFVATEYDCSSVKGLKWNGNQYVEEHTMTITEVEAENLRITHYYGLSEIIYTNIYEMAFNYISKYIYLKIKLHRYISSVNQYYFNKKKLVTKKRMDLLQFMLNDQIERDHQGIEVFSLMSKLYSIQWVIHPSAHEQRSKLELYLESLVEEGELSKINREYVVTGKAISTIEKYEEEERRHTEAVKLQRKMVSLTLIIAFLAIIQSGIIKVPVLLDLTKI